MHCVIYKGRRKQDTYLYVEREGEFSRVPEALLAMLGDLDWVMALDLSERRSLAQADPEQVCRQLRDQGYYLQMPPQDEAGRPFN
jgi:uncharacterized protein